jgi:integrase/recombinase XerD
MVEENLHTDRFALTADEARRIVEASAAPRDRSLLRALVETGMRRAEAAAIDVRDLDLEARRILVRSIKGVKERAVPLTEKLTHDLRALVGARTAGPVFLSNRKAALTPRHVNRIVERAGRLAQVRNPNPGSGGRITCHLLRHTFARLWRERGGDIESLAQILGHKSMARTAQMYGSEGCEDVQAQYRRIMEERSSESSP